MVSEELITPETFPYDRFHEVLGRKGTRLREWAAGERPEDVPVIIGPTWDIWVYRA